MPLVVSVSWFLSTWITSIQNHLLMVLHSAWFPNVFRVKSVITFSPVPQPSDHQTRFVLPPTFYQSVESSLGVLFPFAQLYSFSACLEDVQKILSWSSLLLSFLLLRMSLSVLLANALASNSVLISVVNSVVLTHLMSTDEDRLIRN